MARTRSATALSTTLATALTLLGAAALVGSAGAGAASASTAVPPSHFAGWGTDLTGTPGAYVTMPELSGVGYPDTTMTSDSDRTASIPRGMSTWWGSQTPPGKYWGSSQDQSFLSVRPASDVPGSPSTTTIGFASAAPTGWGFVVGDVDSEAVSVSGVRADGQPASSEDLGFRGTFNACATREHMTSCPTTAGKAPSWDVDLMRLTGSSASEDSLGADAWFVPTVRLRSISLSSTWQAGQPVFQTWLVTRTNLLSGNVSVSDGVCDLTQAEVTLVGADGHPVTTTEVQQDGSWSFGQVAATDDFAARLTQLPPGCDASSGVLRPVALALAGDRADFTVSQDLGRAFDVTGSVKDDENLAVKGAEVTLRVGSIVAKATTDAQGRFTLRDLPPNVAASDRPDSTYAVELTPPGGLVRVGTAPTTWRIDAQDGVAGPLDFIVEGTRLTTPSGGATASVPTTEPSSPASPTTPTATADPTATATPAAASSVTSGTGTTTTPYAAAAAYSATSSSPTTSSLASTGGPALITLLGGLGVLAAGLVTLRGSRRRRA